MTFQNINRVFLFTTVVLLFVLLIIGSILGNEVIIQLMGSEGVICGLVSLYAVAILLNELFGRSVLPVSA